MNRRQSDPTGHARKGKEPSYFTFSPGDQAVGHSGFDKLLRWAEIDFPANPVYAEPQYLPQLRLPEPVVEEKLVEHMQRARISVDINAQQQPMTAPIQKRVHGHHVQFVEPSPAATISPTSSSSRSRNIRPARKSLERQWIALAHQHAVPQPSSSVSQTPK